MSMQGDALDGQPGEGVDSLSELGDMMDTADREDEEAQDESEEEDESERDDAEEEDADDEQEDDGEEPSFTIKVDGKEITLTKAEAVELAQKGTDYSQKTMAVAEERKAVEAERAQVTQVRKRYEETASEVADRLQAYTAFIESQVGQVPDASMLDYDTAGYLRAKEQVEARKGQLQQAYAEIKRVQDEQARQRQAWIAERAESTEKALKDTLTGWSDDTLNTLADYAGKLGLTPQSADLAMLEPGFWQLAHKAKAYDDLLVQKAQLKPKKDLPRVTPPKASNPVSKSATDKTRRIEAHSKRPSLASLGALFGD